MVPQTEEPAARGAASASLVDVEAEPPIKKTCTKQPDGECARARASVPPACTRPVPASPCRAVQASTPLRSWGGA